MKRNSSAGPGRLLARQLVVLLTLLAFVGCTSVRTIDPPDYARTVPEAVDVGSNVEIILKNARTYRVTVTELADTGIRGRIAGGDGKVYLFRYDQIAKISHREISAIKTTLTVIGVVLAVGGIVIGVLVNNFNHENK